MSHASHCPPHARSQQKPSTQLPDVHSWQLPPHTEPSDVQTGREPCGAPEVSVEQVPSLPTTSHASHWPVQAVSQQRPSTQELDAQSPLARHAVPSACAKVAAIVRGAVTFVATYV